MFTLGPLSGLRLGVGVLEVESVACGAVGVGLVSLFLVRPHRATLLLALIGLGAWFYAAWANLMVIAP
jgi:hypothetical protein